MEEKDREQVALFRYGLLAPVLLGQVPSQKEYLAQVASKKHQVPYYGRLEPLIMENILVLHDLS
jgi:putative transposase